MSSQRDKILAMGNALSLMKESEIESLSPQDRFLSSALPTTSTGMKAEDFLSQYQPQDLSSQKRLHTINQIVQMKAKEAEELEKEEHKQRFIKGLLGG